MVDLVIKVGGGTLAHAEHFDRVLAVIGRAAEGQRFLIVPGGGPFADTVRQVYQERRLSDEAAHWMAVLAMDQYAHLIAAELTAGSVVTNLRQIADALDSDHIPVLAPSGWLQEADPLPHAWTVTSDSIAAWVAGAVGARRLVLVKPPGATGNGLVDQYFTHALPRDVTHTIVRADQTDVLASLLAGQPSTD